MVVIRTFLFLLTALPCSTESAPHPEYSSLSCVEEQAAVHCTLTCQDGFVFPDTKEHQRTYQCLEETGWTPNEPVPDCIIGGGMN